MSLKKVIITGGSSGIGAAITKQCLEQKYEVICLSRTLGTLDKTITRHSKFTFLGTDLSDPNSKLQTLRELANIDSLWALINNGPGPKTGPLLEAASDEYQQAFETHLISAQQFTQFACKKISHDHGGRVLNIISITAKTPLSNMSVSNTIRGAMLNWSKTLAKELGPQNITVNNILPGYTDTERLDEVLRGNSEKLNISKETLTQNILQTIPLKRFGKPEELANLALFLLSEQSSYISGTSIPVDGGWTPSSL